MSQYLWWERALGELGIEEWPGEAHNPRVLEYHSVTGRWSRDEVPWCASFVAWCVQPWRELPSRPALARSWRKWGSEVEPTLGAVCVIKRRKRGPDRRTGSRGGYHTGLFCNWSRGGAIIYSGNASNRVGFDYYSKARYEFLAFRG
jgi:uncharacterized protein (TIGR02594 family)